MKNNKVNEDIYSSSSSSTTPAASSSSSGDKTTINIKKKDLSDPSLQKNISSLKNAQVNVIDESSDGPVNLTYLSDVMDSNTGEISKPFTINGKNYQVCRALNANKEKVLGVYSLDESNDNNPIIYEIGYFENNILKGGQPKENDSTDAPIPITQDVGPMEDEKSEAASFSGYKHFIVNRKHGKSRKFKNVSELAKATMTEDEEYMGIQEFKKYIDERLFGAKKKLMQEDDTPTDPSIIASAQKLMDLIAQKIPPQTIKNIQNNTIAQREVILAFAKLIGVPINEVNKIIIGIKNLQSKPQSVTSTDASPSVATSTSTSVTENRVITTIKVKDLK